MSWPEALFYSVAAVSVAAFLIHAFEGGFRLTFRHEHVDEEPDDALMYDHEEGMETRG